MVREMKQSISAPLRSSNKKKPTETIRSHQLKITIDNHLYQRGNNAMQKGYYAGKYPTYFWAYILWLGLNKYTKKLAGSLDLPAIDKRPFAIRVNVEDEVYKRGVELRAKSPLVGIYKGLFWVAVLTIGLDQYEKEILPKEV